MRLISRIAKRIGKLLFGSILARRARQRKRLSWEGRWSRADFNPPWLGRGVAKEIVAAVEEGWFEAGAAALDIGCGQGEVARWLANHGFPTLGVDIAEAAIERARRQQGEEPGRLEYLALDICESPPPDRQYAVLIDRGCLHQIAASEVPSYVANVAAVSAPGAKLLLFMKAFRGDVEHGDPEERRELTERLTAAFRGRFTIERIAETFLDPCDGRDPERALPGLVFWMRRDHRASSISSRSARPST